MNKIEYKKLKERLDEIEEPEELVDQDYICDYNFYNRGDFSTHSEAQKVYEFCCMNFVVV